MEFNRVTFCRKYTMSVIRWNRRVRKCVFIRLRSFTFTSSSSCCSWDRRGENMSASEKNTIGVSNCC